MDHGPRYGGKDKGSEEDEDPWGVAPYKWILIGHDFVECDVIKWTELVWERKGPKKRVQTKKIGEREVIAEVVEEDEEEGWVYLNVLKSRVTWVRSGYWKRRMRVLPGGEIIRRKRHNIVRKGETVYRLPWSDESAREAVLRDRELARSKAAESQPDRRAEDE